MRIALNLALRLKLLFCFVLVSAYGSLTAAAETKAALTVDVVRPQTQAWPRTIPASGNVLPWQEAVIGAETGGQRLTVVAVDVGQRVKKGQLLAEVFADGIRAEVAAAAAQVKEAEAMLAEARANAERARNLRDKGFYSAQAQSQYLTAEQTATARLEAARAALAAAQVRLTQTRIVAPDDGIVSARSAAVGSLTAPGQELFRLIRQGRLEWRAEVAESLIAGVALGQRVRLSGAGGQAASGKVRAVAPGIDLRLRTGQVLVDVTEPGALRAGMFVRGEIELGQAPALSLPSVAIVQRDGFAYAFLIEKAADGSAQVKAQKLRLGRRQADRVEILDGLAADAQVVAGGAAFLADGDSVRLAPAAK